MNSSESTFKTASANANAAAGLLSLPFRDQKWRGGSGGFQGSAVGTSLDFHDHRTYVPGDDPRHINWQAYARSGSYTMKLYREEVRPIVDIILDVSASMFATEAKSLRTLEIFLFCHASATRAGASPRYYLASGGNVTPLDPTAVSHPTWLTKISDLQNPAPLTITQIPLRAAAMRVLISDALFPGDPSGTAATLAGRGGRGLALIPENESERTPEWSGTAEFICSENDARRTTHKITPELVARYSEAYTRHRALWADAFVRHQVAHATIPTGLPLAEALAHAPISREP